MTIKTVGVAGSGTMGAGIAIVAARAGYKTIVYDTRADALERARKQTAGFFAKSVERNKLTQEQVDKIMGGLSSTTKIADMAACDIVIEAVFENLKVKHDLLAQLNKVCPPHTLFASNTSTLSITEIAAGSGRDERFVGMHFCLPAQLMKLVEMSPGIRTSDESFAAAWAFCEAMGQTPVRTKDNPGFILNYFLVPFNNDAIRLVEAGVAAPADIDRAIKAGLGYPLGPARAARSRRAGHAFAGARGFVCIDARSARGAAGARQTHDRGRSSGPQDGAGIFQVRGQRDVWRHKDVMQYAILDTGIQPFVSRGARAAYGAAKDLKSARVVIVIGEHAGRHAKSLKKWKDKAAVLIELGTESLGEYTGEGRAEEGSNVLGFARFRLGNAEPTKLVELVRQPRTGDAAFAAAKEVIEGAGLQVAVCGDFAGRIIDRLVRPYYNAGAAPAG
jgi:3-hydroxybutyryl-CoA dehydrogenase